MLQLWGRWRVVARAGWVALALLTVAVFIGGEIVYWLPLAPIYILDPATCSSEGLPTPDHQVEALSPATLRPRDALPMTITKREAC